MKLIFKQKMLSLLDSYNIYNEAGNIEYTVKSNLGLTHKFRILNKENIELAYVKQCLFRIFPEFKLYVNQRYIGTVKKQFSLFNPLFTLDCKDWRIEGNIFELDYKIIDESNHVVATMNKKLLSLTDKYVLNIKDREDILGVLVIILAIDACKCDNKN